MKHIKGLLLFLPPLFSWFFILYPGKTSKQVQKIHQEVGKELICLKKEYPPIQSKIYSLLDQVGMLYRLSWQTIQRKKTMKGQLKEEQTLTLALRQEKDSLLGKVNNLKQAFKEQNNRLEDEQKRLHMLAKEHETLIRKSTELENREREYMLRMEALQREQEEQRSSTIIGKRSGKSLQQPSRKNVRHA